MFGLLLFATLASDPTDVRPVEPQLELSTILREWERVSDDTKTARLEIACTVNNLVFEEQKISAGELLLQFPGKGSLKLQPEKTLYQKFAIVRNRELRVVHDDAIRRIWTAEKLLRINDAERTFTIIDEPITSAFDESLTVPETFGQYFFWRLSLSQQYADLPFLLEIDSERVQKQWELKLTTRTGNAVILSARPKPDWLKELYSECLVMIDMTTWQTTAVKYIGSREKHEIVYKVNARQNNVPLPSDAFEPDLTGHRYEQSLNQQNPNPEDE